MTGSKTTRKTEKFGVAWEKSYGYPQAVQVKDTIYLSGQFSHDHSGNLIAGAKLDEAGKPLDFSMMGQQLKQSYINAAELLARFGAGLGDVVEETIFVLDIPAAFAVAGKVRKEMYGTEISPCASTIVGVTSLAQPDQLVEVAFRAVVDDPL